MIHDVDSAEDLSEIQRDRLSRLSPRSKFKTEWWAEKVDRIPEDIHDETLFIDFLASKTKSKQIRTLDQMLTRFAKWWEFPASTPMEHVNEDDDGDVSDFIYWLTSSEQNCRDYSNQYADDILGDLMRVYDLGVRKEYFSGPNPFRIAKEEHNLTADDENNVRSITTEHAAQFVQFVRCPKLHVAILFATVMMKRKGEIENIDISHIHIPQQWFYDYLEECDVEMVSEVAQYDEPVIYFPSSPKLGFPYGGEVRRRSNKSKEGQVLRLPDILIAAIHRLLDTRPTYYDTEALFIKQSGHQTGDRIDMDQLDKRHRKMAIRFSDLHPDLKDSWWKEEHRATRMNVTLHYWRHWANDYYQYFIQNPATTRALRGDSGASDAQQSVARLESAAQAGDYDHAGDTSHDVQKRMWGEYLAVTPDFYGPDLPTEVERAIPHDDPADEWAGFRDYAYDNSDSSTEEFAELTEE